MTNDINSQRPRGYCKHCKRRTSHKKDDEWVCIYCDEDMALEDKLTPRKEKILKLLDESQLTDGEIRAVLTTKRPRDIRPTIKHHYGKNKIRIGLISDMHIGSKYYNAAVMDAASQAFTTMNVDAVYSPGDILEGMSGRDGQIYELDAVGYSAQLKKAEGELKKIKQPFYFICGNHDLWARNKANGGLNVGEEIQRRVPNAKYLGDMEATVEIAPGVKMKLTHRGMAAYALSYPGQKMINGLEGGTKPQIILNGNIHKSLYMFYRNIHYLEAGTTQNQTEFMAMKGTPAMVGFWIIDIEHDKGTVTKFAPSWYPIYEK